MVISHAFVPSGPVDSWTQAPRDDHTDRSTHGSLEPRDMCEEAQPVRCTSGTVSSKLKELPLILKGVFPLIDESSL